MKRGLSRRATVASTLVGMLLVVLALAFGAELNDAAAQEPQAASGKELEIRLHRQQTVAGVWAATIAMVTEYIQRIELTDCTVQSEYDMKFYFGRGLCCQNAPECQRYADLTEMPVIMNRISNIRGRYQMGPLPFNRIVQLIDDDKPVIAALAGPGGRGGHLVVIAGYEMPGTVVVLDPSAGRSKMSYSSLTYNMRTGLSWTATYEVQSKRMPQANCTVEPETISVLGPCPNGAFGCPQVFQRNRLVCRQTN